MVVPIVVFIVGLYVVDDSWKLPIFLHNFRSYDSHLIVKALRKEHGPVRVIPTNMQKFLALQVGRVLFLDSMQFANSSLASICNTMGDADFVETK